MRCSTCGVLLALCAVFTIWKDVALAAGYPTRPVRMIVPSGAGSNVDITARQVAQKLAESLGQPVVVENRGGAGGTIGTAAAAKASPDGYTILYGNIPPMAIAPSVYRNLAYDPVKSFAAVARITSLSLALAVSSTLPVNSVPELVAYAKARPNLLNYASSGNGTLSHLSGVLLNNKAGLELRHVPYNNVPQAFSELTSGAVGLIFYPYQGLVPVLQSGRVRLLATTGTKRTPYLPNVPTMMEGGVGDFVVMAWEGCYVPVGTPKAIVNALHAALAKIVVDPAFVSRMAAVGIEVDIAPPDVFAAFTKSEVERFGRLVSLAGVKVEYTKKRTLSMISNTPDPIGMLRKMILIREFDELAIKLRTAGRIYGAVHPYVGQEAVAVGVCANLTDADRVTSTHRGHGHCIAKGADVKRMMAELFGRVDGYCKGRGGSMHIADFAVGMLGANGIVGGGLPLATGAALAAQIEGKGNVAVCFFGDGAVNEGEFHESLNISSVWKLPIVFVCENNQYAANNAVAVQHAITDVSVRAASYGLPGHTIDGNDVMGVREAAGAAIDRARRGEGPTLLECKTYRWYFHSMRNAPPPETRPAAEIAQWKERDPIARLAADLIAQRLITESDLGGLQREVHAALEEAVTFADASPFPDPKDILVDMFAPSP